MNPVRRSAVRTCIPAESVFLAGESGPVWRVVEGLVRLDRHVDPLRQPVQLALPGDLIGVESLCGRPYQLSATAFTDCRLARVPLDARHPIETLLQQALLQSQARSQDMAALRTGTVARRLSHLLGLMRADRLPDDISRGGHPDTLRDALPALRDVAQLVDATTETVCRVLAQLLPTRHRKSAAGVASGHGPVDGLCALASN